MNRRTLKVFLISCAAACVAAAGLLGANPATTPAVGSTPIARGPQTRYVAFGAPRLPPTAAPLPPTASTLIQAPEKRWIPAAIVIRNPRLLPVDRPGPASPRVSADSPPVASLTAPPPWAPRLLPVGPAPRADLPDSSKLPGVVTRARQAPHVLPPTDDPTAQQSGQLSVQVIDKFPRSPAPFLKIAIPDPFPAAADLKLAQPPSDQDQPAPMLTSPARLKKLP